MSDAPLNPGTLLDRFRVDAVIGSGAFGITYKGWDTQLERHVALKEFFPSGGAQRDGSSQRVETTISQQSRFETGLERFLQEARTLARFRHPNIVGVQQYIEANGTGVLVMDLEEGRSLEELQQIGQLDENQLRAIAIPILEGLDAIHQQNVLHRDIKPSNILVRRDGSPVLLDFGAARALSTDADMTVVLTPGFAPIEQYSASGDHGPWTDLYAVGATLYRALTGRAPQPPADRLAETRADLIEIHLNRRRSDCSAEFIDALRWMLQPQPSDRPQTAGAVLEAFAGTLKPRLPNREAIPGTIVLATPEKPERELSSTAFLPTQKDDSAAQLARPERKGNGLLWAGLAAAVLTAGAAGFLFWPGADPVPTIEPTVSVATSPATEVTPARTSASSAPDPRTVTVPAGRYLMGSPEGEAGRDGDEGPQVEVAVSEPFAIAATETTWREFARFVEATAYVTEAERDPSQGCQLFDGAWRWGAGISWRNPGYEQAPDYPVVCVSWNDAAAYTRWLAGTTGRPYRLPSEAEWEYVARAGTTGARPLPEHELCGAANVSDLSRARQLNLLVDSGNVFLCDDGHVAVAPTASLQANPLGVHDMIGNVWEWAANCWTPAPSDAAASGQPCSQRVYRGGSWVNLPGLVRSASRGATSPSDRYFNTGFRVVLEL